MEQAVNSIQDRMFLKQKLQVSTDEFKAAVDRLYPIALGTSEQSQGARSVLLSAYDREEYPIRVPDLQKLRLEEIDACLVVIRACVLNQVEPHTLIDNGMDRFYQLVQREERNNL